MRYAFVIIVGFILLFGCLGGGTQPPVQENKTNETKPNKTIQIIVKEQKNQTTIENFTEEVTPPPPPPPPKGTNLEYENDTTARFGIFFIDVGGPGLHGDAILIKKGNFDMLIDAGSADKGSKVVDFLKAHEVDDIEVLVSTNADPRHYGGISRVADEFAVEEFWWSGQTLNDLDYSALINKMENETKIMRVVEEGYGAELNGMNFTVINPPKTRFTDVNNDAIVMRMVDREFSILFTSGIQTGAQGRLINEHPQEIQAKVMQAPYYGVGSGTSGIGLFLLKADPTDIVISGSSDESAANGGSREPFQRLMKQYGINWYANYVNGTIRVSGDGTTYTIMALGKGQ